MQRSTGLINSSSSKHSKFMDDAPFEGFCDDTPFEGFGDPEITSDNDCSLTVNNHEPEVERQAANNCETEDSVEIEPLLEKSHLNEDGHEKPVKNIAFDGGNGITEDEKRTTNSSAFTSGEESRNKTSDETKTGIISSDPQDDRHESATGKQQQSHQSSRKRRGFRPDPIESLPSYQSGLFAPPSEPRRKGSKLQFLIALQKSRHKRKNGEAGSNIDPLNFQKGNSEHPSKKRKSIHLKKDSGHRPDGDLKSDHEREQPSLAMVCVDGDTEEDIVKKGTLNLSTQSGTNLNDSAGPALKMLGSRLSNEDDPKTCISFGEDSETCVSFDGDSELQSDQKTENCPRSKRFRRTYKKRDNNRPLRERQSKEVSDQLPKTSIDKNLGCGLIVKSLDDSFEPLNDRNLFDSINRPTAFDILESNIDARNFVNNERTEPPISQEIDYITQILDSGADEQETRTDRVAEVSSGDSTSTVPSLSNESFNENAETGIEIAKVDEEIRIAKETVKSCNVLNTDLQSHWRKYSNKDRTGHVPSVLSGDSFWLSSPIFLEPFKHGFKRELVHRSVGSTSDVYYFPPQGKKLRSLNEVAFFLQKNDYPLTVGNFTFQKLLISGDPEFEIARDSSLKPTTHDVSAIPAFKIKAGSSTLTDTRETAIEKSAVADTPKRNSQTKNDVDHAYSYFPTTPESKATILSLKEKLRRRSSRLVIDKVTRDPDNKSLNNLIGFTKTYVRRRTRGIDLTAPIARTESSSEEEISVRPRKLRILGSSSSNLRSIDKEEGPSMGGSAIEVNELKNIAPSGKKNSASISVTITDNPCSSTSRASMKGSIIKVNTLKNETPCETKSKTSDFITDDPCSLSSKRSTESSVIKVNTSKNVSLSGKRNNTSIPVTNNTFSSISVKDVDIVDKLTLTSNASEVSIIDNTRGNSKERSVSLDDSASADVNAAFLTGQMSDDLSVTLPTKYISAEVSESMPITNKAVKINSNLEESSTLKHRSTISVRKPSFLFPVSFPESYFEQRSSAISKVSKPMQSKLSVPPCTAFCPSAKWEIPTLSCSRCFCLYHAVCLGYSKDVTKQFICPSCQIQSGTSSNGISKDGLHFLNNGDSSNIPDKKNDIVRYEYDSSTMSFPKAVNSKPDLAASQRTAKVGQTAKQSSKVGLSHIEKMYLKKTPTSETDTKVRLHSSVCSNEVNESNRTKFNLCYMPYKTRPNNSGLSILSKSRLQLPFEKTSGPETGDQSSNYSGKECSTSSSKKIIYGTKPLLRKVYVHRNRAPLSKESDEVLILGKTGPTTERINYTDEVSEDKGVIKCSGKTIMTGCDLGTALAIKRSCKDLLVSRNAPAKENPGCLSERNISTEEATKVKNVLPLSEMVKIREHDNFCRKLVTPVPSQDMKTNFKTFNRSSTSEIIVVDGYNSLIQQKIRENKEADPLDFSQENEEVDPLEVCDNVLDHEMESQFCKEASRSVLFETNPKISASGRTTDPIVEIHSIDKVAEPGSTAQQVVSKLLCPSSLPLPATKNRKIDSDYQAFGETSSQSDKRASLLKKANSFFVEIPNKDKASRYLISSGTKLLLENHKVQFSSDPGLSKYQKDASEVLYHSFHGKCALNNFQSSSLTVDSQQKGQGVKADVQPKSDVLDDNRKIVSDTSEFLHIIDANEVLLSKFSETQYCALETLSAVMERLQSGKTAPSSHSLIKSVDVCVQTGTDEVELPVSTVPAMSAVTQISGSQTIEHILDSQNRLRRFIVVSNAMFTPERPCAFTPFPEFAETIPESAHVPEVSATSMASIQQTRNAEVTQTGEAMTSPWYTDFVNSLNYAYKSLLRVFSFLSPVDRGQAALTCKFWYKVASDPSLWKHIDTSKQKIRNIRNFFTRMRKLEIESIDLRGLDRKFHCSLLEHLNLPDAKKLLMCPCEGEVIENIFRYCHDLVHLDANDVSASSINLNYMKKHYRLEKLVLNFSTDAEVSKLSFLKKMHKMKHLSLHGLTNIYDVSFLEFMPSLEFLSLGSLSSLDEKLFQESSLRNIKHLKHLSLSDGPNWDENLSILRSISSLDQLVTLEVVYFRVQCSVRQILSLVPKLQKFLFVPVISVSTMATVFGDLLEYLPNLCNLKQFCLILPEECTLFDGTLVIPGEIIDRFSGVVYGQESAANTDDQMLKMPAISEGKEAALKDKKHCDEESQNDIIETSQSEKSIRLFSADANEQMFEKGEMKLFHSEGMAELKKSNKKSFQVHRMETSQSEKEPAVDCSKNSEQTAQCQQIDLSPTNEETTLTSKIAYGQSNQNKSSQIGRDPPLSYEEIEGDRLQVQRRDMSETEKRCNFTFKTIFEHESQPQGIKMPNTDDDSVLSYIEKEGHNLRIVEVDTPQAEERCTLNSKSKFDQTFLTEEPQRENDPLVSKKNNGEPTLDIAASSFQKTIGICENKISDGSTADFNEKTKKMSCITKQSEICSSDMVNVSSSIIVEKCTNKLNITNSNLPIRNLHRNASVDNLCIVTADELYNYFKMILPSVEVCLIIANEDILRTVSLQNIDWKNCCLSPSGK
ncbi:uncharacterized protein LOC136028739 isoform X3 [Artemia franciscana]|uniref:uncharacterized protein LOC136028739 isoform X3 n=1 Tax=Artemia franciscana TaxID=6661 RepID=UPI0032DBB641